MNIMSMLDALIHIEGGYVDHPADKGGPTIWGVTEAVARAFGYTGDMRDMPQDVARRIYKERYWTQPRFGEVHQLSQLIAEELLDTGVNMGTAIAARFLQRALNVLGHPLTVDGNIGKMTLYALKRFLDHRGKDGERVLFAMLNAQQSVRYIELAEADHSQVAFEYGWQRMRVVV